ncbi:TetR/AcrR family transcriptional regulator [Streptomyces sp. CAI-121]|uniref:TetR/AcrR family transcriptional regulator n=1 Tax=unclassified Streptomyces TaxID=2593676 RepID=UPI001587E7CC|nr:MULTISPECIES: TetR family transcriptional regulator [unclassified Streptomyces]NUV66434.1 TetR/AcrR family transcriptional regulator [Streptomyces sp. CAI-121]NUW11884.1 TetR/AcrR family transcriptional regulator [Streptomyces sp. CAI-68]
MSGRITAAEGRYGGRDADERRAERHQRFLEAGLEMFGARTGYRGTKIADLCRAAGLSSRQFYEEFRTLEDLLAELHLYVNDLAEQAVLDILPAIQDEPPRDRLALMLRAYVKGATTDLRHARIAYVEIVGVSPRLDRQRLERRAVWIDLLGRQIDEALARGELVPDDYRIASAAFIGAVNGLMHDWVVGWVDVSAEEIADELTKIAMGRFRIAD